MFLLNTGMICICASITSMGKKTVTDRSVYMKRVSKGVLVGVGILSFSITGAFAATITRNSTATVNIQGGNLTLDQVPANFNFGNVPYPSSPTTTTLPVGTPYLLQVSDYRGVLLGLGYKVTVSAPKMRGTNTPTNLMHGNNIRMQNGVVAAIGPIIGVGPVANQDFYVDAVDTNGAPLSTTILSAQAGISSGLLSWGATWSGPNISLVLSAGEAPVDSYNSTITWTLYDAP
jgi:hypothetical protein